MTLTIALMGVSLEAEGAVAPGQQSTPQTPRSSSKWLRAGEARQAEGDHAGAGQAYTMALKALSPKKQVANEGARTAMLAAEAYWLAFESDDSLAHLSEGFKILDEWLEKAGPGSRATLLPMVERMAVQIKAVHDPLEKGAASLAADDLEHAAEHHKEALEALASQRRAWGIGARVTLRIANAHVVAYDKAISSAETIEPNQPTLLVAKDFLEGWQQRRPTDDESKEGPEIEQLLLEIQRRLDEGNQAVLDAALADQQGRASEAAAAKVREQEAADERRRQDAEAADKAARRRRTVSIVLLSSGAVAAATGAGLLGEGLAFSAKSKREGDAQAAEAQALSDMHGDDYPREDFDAALDTYYADARRHNIAFIASGSVLVAGGVAAGVVGLVRLRKDRSAKRKGTGEQARLTPSASRSHLGIVLSTRF